MAPVVMEPDVMDRLLERIEVVLAAAVAAQGSKVKEPAATLELLRECEAGRDFMMSVLQNTGNERALLHRIFGGDCRRVSQYRALLLSWADHAASPRLASCFHACDSMEQVLRDAGQAAALSIAHARATEYVITKRLTIGDHEDLAKAREAALKMCAWETIMATRIQARIRGHILRRRHAEMREQTMQTASANIGDAAATKASWFPRMPPPPSVCCQHERFGFRFLSRPEDEALREVVLSRLAHQCLQGQVSVVEMATGTISASDVTAGFRTSSLQFGFEPSSGLKAAM